MARNNTRITLDDLPHLPGGCGQCAFWQLDGVRRRGLDHCDQADEVAGWASMVLREWGSCGRVARVDGRIVGHVLYAPPVMVPGAGGFPTSPVSPDAVLLVSLRVDSAHRNAGIARTLVQSMAKDLIKRGGIRAVEAFGDTRGGAGQRCVIPAEFLLSVGFRTLRAHSTTPRLRMDLRTAVTWREELEEAFDWLRGAVTRPVTTRVSPAEYGDQPMKSASSLR